MVEGQRVRLIDTPGFDDSYKSEGGVLTIVADFLAKEYVFIPASDRPASLTTVPEHDLGPDKEGESVASFTSTESRTSV